MNEHAESRPATDDGVEIARRVLLRGVTVAGLAGAAAVALPASAASAATKARVPGELPLPPLLPPLPLPAEPEPAPQPEAEAPEPAEPELPTKNGKQALVATSDVPVGGGVVLEQEFLVITQPKKGTFKGFYAGCTHAGCLCDAVRDGCVVCPCHDACFSIKDGKPKRGPAKKPLEPEKIKVSGGYIYRG